MKVALTIYGYEKEGQVVYVGQTRVPLKDRDQEHRRKKTTEFDRDYANHRNLYGPPIVLGLMVRTHHFSSDLDRAKAMHKWQIWMDDEEIYFIKLYGTYFSGLNRTKGGQMNGRNVACFQAQLKASERVWTETYMPIFRSMETGRNKCLWKTPRSHKMGRLLDHCRSGNTSVPHKYAVEIRELGFEDKSPYESRWNHEYIPAFRDSSYGRQKCLWQTPARHVVHGIAIGQLISHIRKGHTSVPTIHIAELERMGLQQGRTFYDCLFEFVQMRALRTCSYAQEKRLSETPDNYVTENGVHVGELVRRMRRGRSPIPSLHREELVLFGLFGPPETRKRKSR
jgi:hypothetical protein